MALINKLSTVKVVNPEGDRILLKDATGNYGEESYTPSLTVEGEYTLVVNSTGYGDPNATRESVANFIIGKLKRIAGDIDVSFENYNPLTATEFSAIIPEDGHYVFTMITIPVYETDSEIPVGEYGFVDEEVLFNDGTVFVIQSNIDSLLGTTYASTPVDCLHLANASFVLNDIISYLVNLFKGDLIANRSKITRTQSQLNIIKTILHGIAYEYARGNKTNAQGDIEYLNKYITDIQYGV